MVGKKTHLIINSNVADKIKSESGNVEIEEFGRSQKDSQTYGPASYIQHPILYKSCGLCIFPNMKSFIIYEL